MMIDMENESSAVTLSDVAYVSRLTIKWGTIGFIVLFFLRTIVSLLASILLILNPPKPPGPTYGFGILPKLTFDQSAFTVSSISDEIPSSNKASITETQLPVYFVPEKKIHLFSNAEANTIAKAFGFLEPSVLDEKTTYTWTTSQPMHTQLKMDVSTKQFSLTTDWINHLDKFSGQPMQKPQAIAQLRSTLRTAEILSPDIATSEAKTQYLTVQGTEFSPVDNVSDAQFIRVDLFRSSILSRYPVYRTNPSEGSVWAIFSGATDNALRILQASYQLKTVEYDQSETYPILTPEEAVSRVVRGEGYVAQYSGSTGQGVVRRMFLAYFEENVSQQYLQPMYVFTGDDGLVVYLPAVVSTPPKK